MKRKVTLTSTGDYSGVKITIEMTSKPGAGRGDIGRAVDCLIDGCTKAITDAPMTGAAYAHQVKVSR